MENSDAINILLIEDEEFDVKRVENTINFFKTRIFIKDIVSNGKAALDLIVNNMGLYDVVILDYQISGGLMGSELIEKIKDLDQSLQIIVITKMTININDYHFANNLLKAGAFWYCTKYPGNIEDYIYQPTDFTLSIINAYEKKLLEKQYRKSDKKLNQNINNMLESKKIIGNSKPIIDLKKNIEKYSKSKVNVLISGPSGTGKELVAWNMHLTSSRKHENFVRINCGSIPDDLIESELFGYEKGAFTGANNKKSGLFEVANKGSIFLDEIAELPANAQVKLLRVIQEGEIEKIGRTGTISVDVRIIAATNKNLAQEVSEGRFREDLFYRLNVVLIDIEPLSQRGDDIIILFEHFMEYFAIDLGLPKPNISDDAKDILKSYSWPGNVRELRNVVQRLILNVEGDITAKDISDPMILRKQSLSNKEFNIENMKFDEVLPLKTIERNFRTNYIKYIRSISNNDSSAAEKLGLAPSNYYRMCKELGLK